MCVVTDKNICVFKGDECIRTYTVSDCSNTVSEVGVGVGMLVTQLDGRQQRILRYSSKHRTRFAYIARGINILSSGRTEEVVSKEYETVCEKCGISPVIPLLST